MHTSQIGGAGHAGWVPLVLIDKQTGVRVLEGKVTTVRSGKGWVGSIASDERLLKAIRGVYRVMLANGSLFDVDIEHVAVTSGTRIDFIGIGARPNGTC